MNVILAHTRTQQGNIIMNDKGKRCKTCNHFQSWHKRSTITIKGRVTAIVKECEMSDGGMKFCACEMFV